MYLCTTSMSGAWKGQKNVADPLELKLHIIISNHVSVREQIQVIFMNTFGAILIPEPSLYPQLFSMHLVL